MRTSIPAQANAELPIGGSFGVSSRKLRLQLVAGLVTVNVLVFMIAIYSLLGSKALHEKTAKTLTQNIASAIDLNISRDVQKVDLALQAVVDELQHELSENE